MSIIAQSADGVQHQFPDGTPPAVIDKAMRDYVASNAPKPAPAPPSSTWDAIRSIPGGLAKGAAATAGFTGDVRELATSGVRAVAGDTAANVFNTAVRYVPAMGVPTSEELNNILSKPTGGYYVPKTTAGRYAETIASFAPAAIGGEGGAVIRAARVAIPAIASEAAGEATAGTPAEPYARAGGAILGGGILAAERPVIRSINALATRATGSGFLDPSVEATRSLQSAVERDGGVAALENRTRNYANSGASTPALIDVGGNNVRRLVRAAAATEGEGQNTAINYADRIRAALPDRAVSLTRGLTPNTPQNAAEYGAELEATRSREAATNYKAPYAQPASVTPEMVSALQGPEGRGAINRAYAAARANRDSQAMAELKDLQEVASEGGATPDPLTGRRRSLPQALANLSAGSLDRVRIAMRDIGTGLRQRGANDIARGYAGRVNDIDTALDQTPALVDARAAYRARSAEMDAVTHGAAGLNLPSDQYAAEIARLGSIAPNARTAAGVGFRQSVVDAIRHPKPGQTGVLDRVSLSPETTDNLSATFGPDATARYQAGIRNEVDRLRNANFISPNSGSQTALREGEASLVSLPHIPRTMTGFVLSVVNKIRAGTTLTPAERAEIVRLGTTEADLRKLARSPQFSTGARVAVPAAVGANQQNGP